MMITQKAATKKKLFKAREYKKRNIVTDTEDEKKSGLDKRKQIRKNKIAKKTYTQTQATLDKKNAYQKKKRNEQSDSDKHIRLFKRRINYRDKQSKNNNDTDHFNNKQNYLETHDVLLHGYLHEQDWAKSNMSKFHDSNSYVLCHCNICFKAWPLKSRPKNHQTYVCSRCSRDKKSPKTFSAQNKMFPSPVPIQLEGLTQTEEMLIAHVMPIMRVYIKPGGQRGYSGHCINLPQNVNDIATSLPRYPKDLSVIIVKVKGRDNTFKDVNVRRQKVYDVLMWLINNNPHYSDVEINYPIFNSLPDNGVPSDLLTVDADEIMTENTTEIDLRPSSDNPSEDI